MHIYFAAPCSDKYVNLLREEGVEDVLFSYAFFKKKSDVQRAFGDYKPKNVIVDSGAFSVWTRGEEIDLDKYAFFCNEMKEQFPDSNLYFVNVDVIPGRFGQRPTAQQIIDSAEEGWKNMEYLESKGLKVIPVFHQHEDFAVLDKLRNHTDYIGISPANDVSMDEKMNWLKKSFSIVRDTIKAHGFAVTAWEQVSNLPYFSVDSSSWTSPARFGSVPIFTPMGMKIFKYKEKEQVHKYWEYIQDIDINKLSAVDDWTYRVRVAIRSYLKMNKVVNELWKDRGINYNE